MKKTATIILALILVTTGLAQTKSPKWPLKVSANGRYLVYADGTPFFYLGDTAWELFHRLNRKEVLLYLNNRKEKGFTVIQAVALAELDGLHTPNAEGQTPLINDDPSKPNEAYFKYVDWVIDEAAQLGIFIGLLPTWGDKLNKAWGDGPVIFTPENAEAFGRFIGDRYKNRQNIIWILGGDRNPKTETHQAVWRNMAKGIIDGVGGPGKAMMTFHPQGSKPGGSSNWFHHDDWLDFNMHQTGHCRDGVGYNKIAFDYSQYPVKPTMDGEPLYEEHPVCFDGDKNGFSNAFDIRKKAYWHTFYGAHGHTYGCAAIWQMYDKGRPPMHKPLRTWSESLNLPGAGQMKHLKNLLLSRPFLTRVPDQSIIAGDNPEDSLHMAATRDENGTYLMLYTPVARTVKLNTSSLNATKLNAWWYDPRTGKSISIGKMDKQAVMEFKAPTTSAEDWILVLDNATAKYAAPGKL